MSLDIQIRPASLDSGYNPDVLTCLANLSNDEVFTPPMLANDMLDQLPEELWSDPNATFLDPVSKSGVFLREIAKRLMIGLESQIPDTQERINHIYTKQIFGIGITELTALLTRRSLYCSKYANGKYSIVTDFKDEAGNVDFTRVEHKWFNDHCVFCKASQSEYDRSEDLETHAYKFIHTNKPEELYDMQFDVIIGNPPYQLNVGKEQDNYAIPIYQKFIEQAIKLQPRYLTMIIPARWYAGGRGLDAFRDEMLHDQRIRKLVDYPNATDAFPGVDISGGVCYFLWDRDNPGLTTVSSYQRDRIISSMDRPLLEQGNSTLVRFNEAIPILRKIASHKEQGFDTLVSPQTPFGLYSSFKDYKESSFEGSIALHTVKGQKWINRSQISKNAQWIDDHKVYISKSYGERGNYPYLFLAKPFLGAPGSCCTQTYLMIGPFESESIAQNVRRYISTRFFRFCIMQRKNTQDAMRNAYSFAPVQDFTKEWTDEKLYKKYGITEDEIAFIESMIRPMELGN